MYRAIMVPLDGSSFSEHALPLAIGIARRDGATIHLVHVSGPVTPIEHRVTDPLGSSLLAAELLEEMTVYMDRMRERTLFAAPVAVNAVILQGVTAPELESYAAANAIDLIVMATHGRGGINRTWIGSIAETVIRHARIPVLLARPGEDEEVDPGERLGVQRVLVPLDNAAHSEKIIPHALMVASLFDAEMVLMQVVAPVQIHSRAITSPVIDVDDDDLARRVDLATDHLSGIADRLQAPGRRISTMVVTDPRIASAIIRTAEEQGAEIIAMATHARAGIGRMLLGSVSDKVVRGTTRAVLLYRPE